MRQTHSLSPVDILLLTSPKTGLPLYPTEVWCGVICRIVGALAVRWQLVFWAQSTTEDNTRAQNRLVCLLLILHISLQTTIFLKSTQSVLTQIYISNIYIHKHQTQNCRRIVPSVLPLLEKHIRLGHAGIVDHFVDLSIKKKKINIKKGMDRSNKKY